ncbi:MAG TPA: c-type cytochrome, partial [Caulobacteraceae bacterium]
MRIAVLAVLVGAAVAPACAQDVTRGQAAFEDRCTMCHAPTGGQGPKLAGVVGRKAGVLAGFAYSAALKA